MATINPICNRNVSQDGSVIVAAWGPMANGDVGAPITFSAWSDKTYQVSGTLGTGGTLLVEGSNDGTTWSPIFNRQGTAMNFNSASGVPSINTSQDRPIYVRPRVTAGDGTTSLMMVVACHRTDIGGV